MALRTLITRNPLKSAPPLASRGLHTFSLPDLPYDYGELEPAISAEIMQLHHQKHHQAYITNYNKALEQLDAAAAKGDAPTVVKLQSAIKFNGGGICIYLPTVTLLCALIVTSISSQFIFNPCFVTLFAFPSLQSE